MRTTISHNFVDVIPESIDEGVVYVCAQYETAIHRCCCGCGNEVVSPLHPRQWSFMFDGETISLTPSLGNSSFPVSLTTGSEAIESTGPGPSVGTRSHGCAPVIDEC